MPSHRISTIDISRRDYAVGQKMRHVIADIADCQRSETEILLNIERPLLCHRRFQISVRSQMPLPVRRQKRADRPDMQMSAADAAQKK